MSSAWRQRVRYLPLSLGTLVHKLADVAAIEGNVLWRIVVHVEKVGPVQRSVRALG
jgi:hypothetical protein